jgi:hypothetical protein
VHVSETHIGLSRAGGGELLTADDFVYVPSGKDGPHRRRTWMVTAGPGSRWNVLGETLRTRTPRNPFGTVTALVVAPPGFRLVSNVAPVMNDRGRSGGIDLRPQRSAYLLVGDRDLSRSEGGPVPATLVAFLQPSPSGQAGEVARLVQELESRLLTPDRWSSLQVFAAAAQPPPDPGGSRGDDEGGWNPSPGPAGAPTGGPAVVPGWDAPSGSGQGPPSGPVVRGWDDV